MMIVAMAMVMMVTSSDDDDDEADHHDGGDDNRRDDSPKIVCLMWDVAVFLFYVCSRFFGLSLLNKESFSEEYELRAPAQWYRKLRVKVMSCIPQARCGGRWHDETLICRTTSQGPIQTSGWA